MQHRSVLLVEDDPLMQAKFIYVINSIDRDIIVDRVATAEEAKDLIENEDSLNYSLVVADQFLEGQVTGMELWSHFHHRRPDIPFLLTSGTNLPAALSRAGSNRELAFIQKPFSNAQGREVIKRLLRRPTFFDGVESVDLPKTETIWGMALVLYSLLIFAYTMAAFESHPETLREMMSAPQGIEKSNFEKQSTPPYYLPLKEFKNWDSLEQELWKTGKLKGSQNDIL